ncbi:MAG: metal-dependent transcriptional regulator [Chloroflexaceae bacterium]|nr:metal-dependent transcriptional regulator [Chloroflexaceae bacterium]NJO07887.1 metal-dependent transcriptional regulator [Chloroflexaceae bacterium]
MALETPNRTRSRTNPRRRHLSGQDGPTDKEREYLEIIYYLTARDEPVISARLADWMGVQPPTVTHVVKQLEAKHYITRNERGEISFTPEGFAKAQEVVRRHRILERFLVDVMRMPWHLIHEEAVRLEHALSPMMETQIEKLVGESSTCPHGNPIPGMCKEYMGKVRLDEAPAERQFTIRRIIEEAEEDSELMRYLQSNDLMPNSQFTVIDSSTAFGVTLQRRNHNITVSPEIAAVLWGDVEPLERPIE